MIVDALSYWKIASTFSVNSSEYIDSRREILLTYRVRLLSLSPLLSSEVRFDETRLINIDDYHISVEDIKHGFGTQMS